MNRLRFNNIEYELKEYESVLDCLLRNAQAIPYACKAGMCQACLIKAVGCDAGAESKKWIKPTLQAQGYTLACQWVPETDVAAALPAVEDFSVSVRIRSLDYLNPSVIRVLLEVPDRGSMFSSHPGQYVTLINPHGIARSYSIANNYESDQYLELHIGSTRYGIFTRWLFNEARIGDELHMRGPAGDCFYIEPEQASTPLLLAATGTGLSPLFGILNDALQQGHVGEIHLYHGGRTQDQLYYVNELNALAKAHTNFHYIPCTIAPTDNKSIREGGIEQIIDSQLDSSVLPKTNIYLCGAPNFVHSMRKKVFLKGAKSSNIHCDPFTERVVSTTTTQRN